MVAIFPEPGDTPKTLFKYLKRCQPTAPNIAFTTGNEAASDPFDRLPLPKNRRQRGLSLLLGCAQVAAIALGLWVSALPQRQTILAQTNGQTRTQQTQNDLWDTLGSEALAQGLLAEQEKQTATALTAAKQARLQAQQLRLEAEAQAQTLTSQAAKQARQKTVEAIRRADLIALEATYIGAEQVLYTDTGDDITLKFAARIQCKDGSFGETAVAAPVDSRITPREVRNLASCYPSGETPAGEPIGQAGAWGVAFFQLE
ncbi:MAG: hypothetical protein AAF171_01995 [Cyanobacteria bacterium P01_A01_bin.116]